MLKKPVLYGAAAGLVYGLGCRLTFGLKPFQEQLLLMSLSFVVVVPFAMGLLTVLYAEKQAPGTAARWVFLPWLPAVISIAASVALLWEGAICALFMLPNTLLLASLGGVTAGLWSNRARKRSGSPMLVALALPFLAAPLETQFPRPVELRTVENRIDIQASAEVVWDQIKRVRTIQPQEQKFSWTQKIGFPRPLDATLSREAAGAVREARFAGGVMFLETVNTWEPPLRLAFDIRADTANIPPATLDEHVIVGGPFFDVLRGEYRVEPIGAGAVRLHLASRHRLSTHFNMYARLWSGAVMRDVQANILHVIRNRSESRAAGGAKPER